MVTTCKEREYAICILVSDGPKELEREELEDLERHLPVCPTCQRVRKEYVELDAILDDFVIRQRDWDYEAEKFFELVGLRPKRTREERIAAAKAYLAAHRRRRRAK